MSSLSELRGYHSLEGLARRLRGHKLRWTERCPSLGHWAVQIFTVGLSWLVFANVQDREQTITIALLGLAYAGLRGNATANRLTLRRIASILETSQNTQVTAADRAAWLDYTGLTLLGLICLYHLGIALLYGAALKQILELN